MMLAIPAAIAGCREVVLCTPSPASDEILFAARACGVEKVFAIGGARAIAAMAYGTQSIPKVDKIFGPGNAYVTEAKGSVARLARRRHRHAGRPLRGAGDRRRERQPCLRGGGSALGPSTAPTVRWCW